MGFKLKKSYIKALLIALCLFLVLSVILTAQHRHDAAAINYDKLAAKSQPCAELPPSVSAMKALSGMSLDEKVWQMLFVFPQDVSGEFSSSDSELWHKSQAQYPAGGFVIGSENMQSAAELHAMLACISETAQTSPLIGVDEEGGRVARLAYTLGVTTDFLPMFDYKEGGKRTAHENAFTIGTELSVFGFNLNFAPVADVWTNPKNTVIARRAYSDDAAQAAELVSAAVQGFSDAGIISVLKHFPGHGDTAQDSHFAKAYSDKTLAEIRVCELLPFAAGIEAGAGMVMIGHITLSEISGDKPATISPEIISGLLRGEMAYKGVVITDSMKMDAITDLEENEACILAIKAGADIILGAENPKAVAEAIKAEISAARINASVYRILRLKYEHGII